MATAQLQQFEDEKKLIPSIQQQAQNMVSGGGFPIMATGQGPDLKATLGAKSALKTGGVAPAPAGPAPAAGPTTPPTTTTTTGAPQPQALVYPIQQQAQALITQQTQPQPGVPKPSVPTGQPGSNVPMTGPPEGGWVRTSDGQWAYSGPSGSTTYTDPAKAPYTAGAPSPAGGTEDDVANLMAQANTAKTPQEADQLNQRAMSLIANINAGRAQQGLPPLDMKALTDKSITATRSIDSPYIPQQRAPTTGQWVKNADGLWHQIGDVTDGYLYNDQGQPVGQTGGWGNAVGPTQAPPWASNAGAAGNVTGGGIRDPITGQILNPGGENVPPIAGDQPYIEDPRGDPGTPVRPTIPPIAVGPPGGAGGGTGGPPGTSISDPTRYGGTGSAGEPRPTFGPGNDLTDNVIDPGVYRGTPESDRARGLTLTSLESAMGGPDRGEIARGQYGLLLEELARDEARMTRDIGRANASWGRMGSGMVTSDLADMGVRLGEIKATEGRRLGLEAADKELMDRINRTELGSRTGGQFSSEDLNRARFQQSQRDELRGERGYQYDTKLDALSQEERDARLQEFLTQGEFGRDAMILEIQMEAEQSADPASVYASWAASAEQMGPNYSWLADLWRSKATEKKK